MLYLASRSPRRRQLLEQIGVPFRPLDVDVPEQPAPGESPEAYVARVACDKARAGHARVDASTDAVLGSDTEVVLDDEVFGKPDDAAGAVTMLRRLSGRTHRVVSCVCLVDARGEHAGNLRVRGALRAAGRRHHRAYVATGESFGKAGGYAIQGRAAAFVGAPVRQLFRRHGPAAARDRRPAGRGRSVASRGSAAGHAHRNRAPVAGSKRTSPCPRASRQGPPTCRRNLNTSRGRRRQGRQCNRYKDGPQTESSR